MSFDKKKISFAGDSRLRQLDRIVPLVSLGLVAYVAGKAAADRRAAARDMARIGAATPVTLAPAAAANGDGGRRGIRKRMSGMSRTRQVLFLMLLVGIIAMVAGGGTFATFSAETGNPGSQVASGTLTLSDKVNIASACLSKDATSFDNYNEQCDAMVLLANQAPGVTDTSGTYPGGFAKLTLANTGSINASLFSLFAPYTNTRLTTAITSGMTIGSGQTVTSFAVSALEGPVAQGDVITLTANGATQTFCAGTGGAPAGATSIPISGGYPIGTSGSCPASSPSTTLNTGGTLSSSATSLIVTSSSGFPTSGNYVITIDSEQLLVTGGQGTTTWTVVRGFNGTSAATHANGATVGTGPVLAGANYAATGGTATTRVADTSTDTIGAPTTTLASTVTSGTNPITVAAGFSSSFPSPPFTILVDSEQMRVTAESGTGNVNWTVTRGYNGTSAAAHNGGVTITGVPNTDCYDAQTGVSYQVNGSSYGSQLNFNSPTLNPLCTSAEFFIQESTSYGGTTYHYCWFGRGSTYGDQTTHIVGGGTGDANQDSSGQCRTPTTLVLAATVTAGSASYSVNAGTLNGNIRSGDTVTFVENGNTMTCTAASDYFIGLATGTTPVSVNTCSGGGAQVYDSSATVKDQSSFDSLNQSNPSSTLSNFDTAHHSSGPIYMLPLSSDAHRNFNATVELGKSGTAGSSGVAPDTRIFYVGVYIPAGSGAAQNGIQGLVSTFGLTWHIDQ
jgi:hypothetical protein